MSELTFVAEVSASGLVAELVVELVSNFEVEGSGVVS